MKDNSKKIVSKLRTVLCSFYNIPAKDKTPEGKIINGVGHVCLAVQYPTKSNSKTYRIAASFKSPLDMQNFDKGKGIALGRLARNRNQKSFNVEIPFKSENKVLQAALRSLLQKTRKVRRRNKEVLVTVVPRWLNASLDVGNVLREIRFSSSLENL